MPPSRRAGGWAVAGLVLGMIGIVFGTITAIVMIPRLREQTSQARCMDNLRLLGRAVGYYTLDHNAYPPDLPTLARLGYLAPPLPTCPAGHDYTWTAAGARPSRVTQPAATVIAYDAVGAHAPGCVIALFADGHAEELTEAETQQVLSAVEPGGAPPVLERQ